MPVTENELFLTDEEGPAPNGVYYGFTGDGTRATVEFNKTAQVKHVKVDGPDKRRYNEFLFAMVGKAIHGAFRKDWDRSGMAHVLLEPVDREKFNGSRESFSHAQINTVEGRPFTTMDLPRLFGKASTAKVARNRTVRRLKTIGNTLSGFLRHRKDDDNLQLLIDSIIESD
ncbi:hypothetical protein FOZ62_001925 [Perkinsus olseni]|uniref:Uncharacterized protein n=1 Tax=Perkinsus olseni TaxID=32597 RepID=A0A7J6RTD5_PEROL|nr:hypothetical protein FOZ62_001925 [Perkinsus olseni]